MMNTHSYQKENKLKEEEKNEYYIHINNIINLRTSNITIQNRKKTKPYYMACNISAFSAMF